MSPAERALLQELEARGAAGMDYLEQRSRGFVDMAGRLIDLGQVRLLKNGRIVGNEAFARACSALETALAERDELHVRDVAKLLDVSRGAVAALLDALIRDGRIVERGPTVVALTRGTDAELES